MDIRAALEAAGGDEVTVLVNSPGGDMAVGAEIRSMLRRYQGKTTALFQGYGASAATLAVSACTVIQSEPGALLCYHNPSNTTSGDFHEMRRSAEALRNARDCILEMYTARSGSRSREELISLMDKNIWITPTQAKRIRPDRRDRGAGRRHRAGGGPGGIRGGGRPHPADGGYAGTVPAPCGGGPGGRRARL